MTLRSAVRHSAKAIAEGTLIALLVVGLVAGAALAAKGGNATGKPTRDSGSTMSVVVLDGSDATPNHTERITFDVSTSATDRPFVQLMCWQGSTGVYNKSIGIFESYLFDPWFTLDSTYWTAGQAADCTARLYHYDRRGNQKDLSSMAVTVAP